MTGKELMQSLKQRSNKDMLSQEAYNYILYLANHMKKMMEVIDTLQAVQNRRKSMEQIKTIIDDFDSLYNQVKTVKDFADYLIDNGIDVVDLTVEYLKRSETND